MKLSCWGRQKRTWDQKKKNSKSFWEDLKSPKDEFLTRQIKINLVVDKKKKKKEKRIHNIENKKGKLVVQIEENERIMRKQLL